MKILIVDDEPNIREVCRRILGKAGYETQGAESGEKALPLLASDWDIVLTDLDMPGTVDGNELTRRARAAGSADVIIMTGNPELETAIQGMRDGAYDYLVKPFSEEALNATVGRCIDKRLLSRELAREKALRTQLHAAYTRLEEMQKVRDIFGQFATPEVAELVLAHPDDFRARGEQKTLTVLFTDVRGFTPFAEQVTPSQAVATLNEIFECVIAAVRAEGGVLNKFLGDGVMALFGAPLPLKDHASAAARAALSALAALRRLEATRPASGRPALKLGVGINTGEMVAGCLGSRERTEYTVIGHPVNLAARLVEAAGPGQILVGPETAKRLGSPFLLRPKGPLSFPGIAEPVSVTELSAPN